MLAAVALLRNEDREVDGDAEAGEVSPNSGPASESTRVSPEEFCSAFRVFADASSQYLARPDKATGELLSGTGARLGEVSNPLGLDAGGMASLEQLVNGTLAQIGEAIEVRTSAAPDPPSLDAYLATTCPA